MIRPVSRTALPGAVRAPLSLAATIQKPNLAHTNLINLSLRLEGDDGGGGSGAGGGGVEVRVLGVEGWKLRCWGWRGGEGQLWVEEAARQGEWEGVDGGGGVGRWWGGREVRWWGAGIRGQERGSRKRKKMK